MPIAVSIVSDDRISSEGLRRILANDGSLRLTPVADQPPLPRAIRAANAHVILLDGRMHNAIALCEQLHQDSDGPTIILFAVADDDEQGINALAAGARGILQRSARPEDIARAVHVVYDGQIWAPRHLIVAAWLGDMKRAAIERRTAAAIEPHLTARELEVLHHAAAGLGNKEVAKTLSISEATVKVHLTRIFQKLGLRGRARLAAAYHSVHLPSPDARVRSA